MADSVVAVDAGGTSLKGALAGPDGLILDRRTIPTPRAGGVAAIDAIAELCATLVELGRGSGHRPMAAGVGIPGLVDERHGVALWSTNIGWRDVPVRDRLSTSLGLPVEIGHDVRLAAVAEG